MKKGCLIGCLVAAGLFVLLMGVGLFALGFLFDAFSPWERVALTGIYGDSHAVVVRVDPYSGLFLETVEMALGGDTPFPWLISYALPHEALLVWDADPAKAVKTATIALSTKRLARLLLRMGLLDPEIWDVGEDYDVTDVGLDDNGVLHLTAQGSLSEAAMEEAEKHWWRQRSQGTALVGGHLLEIVLDNSAGGAFLVLESEVRGIEVGEDEKEVGAFLDEETLSTLFYQVATVRVTMDLPERDRLTVVVDVASPDSEAAAAVLIALGTLRDRVGDALSDRDFQFEGDFERDRHEIHGTFTVSGFEARLIEAVQEAFQDFQKGQS